MKTNQNQSWILRIQSNSIQLIHSLELKCIIKTYLNMNMWFWDSLSRIITSFIHSVQPTTITTTTTTTSTATSTWVWVCSSLSLSWTIYNWTEPINSSCWSLMSLCVIHPSSFQIHSCNSNKNSLEFNWHEHHWPCI